MGEISRRVCVALLVTLMSGCSLPVVLENQIVDHNKAVENAQNKMTFLNIIRAAHRTGMVYSSISQVTQTNKDTAGLGLNVPFGRNTMNPFIGSSEVSTSSQPIYTMANSFSQDFNRGILQPTEPSVFLNFVNAGWPVEFVLLLLVEKIQVCADAVCSRVTSEIFNDPNIADDFKSFREDIRSIASRNPRFRAVSAKRVIKETTRTTTNVQGQTTEETVRETERAIVGLELLMDQQGLDRGEQVFITDSESRVDLAHHIEDRQNKQLMLRSPQGVLFYLGQLLGTVTRHLKDAPGDARKLTTTQVVTYFRKTNERILFLALEGRPTDDAVLTVGYGGTTYYILKVFLLADRAAPLENRALQAMAFAAQVIGLQQSVQELRGGQTLISIE